MKLKIPDSDSIDLNDSKEEIKYNCLDDLNEYFKNILI